MSETEGSDYQPSEPSSEHYFNSAPPTDTIELLDFNPPVNRFPVPARLPPVHNNVQLDVLAAPLFHIRPPNNVTAAPPIHINVPDNAPAAPLSD